MTSEVKELRELLHNLHIQQYINAVLNTRRIAVMAFLVGILNGLGATIGASIALALLILTLSKLEVVPYIGKFVAEIIRIVQQQQNP